MSHGDNTHVCKWQNKAWQRRCLLNSFFFLECVSRSEGRTIRVLFHACAVQKRLAQQVYCSDLRADIGTLYFPDKIQT